MAQFSEIHRQVKAICEEVLGVSSLSQEDNLFSVGVDSLRLIRLVSEVDRVCHVLVDPIDLMKNPTVAHFGDLVSLSLRDGLRPQSIAPLGAAKKRVSLAQERHYVFESKRPRIYNIGHEVFIQGKIDFSRFQQCFSDALKNNGVFNYIFSREGTEIIAVPSKQVAPLRVTDLRSAVAETVAAELKQIRAAVFAEFDIWREPAVRAELVAIADEEAYFCFCANHILLDGESLQIFLLELYSRYSGAAVTRKDIDFYDFAVWERQQVSQDDWDGMRGYWRDKLSRCRNRIAFPSDGSEREYLPRASVETAIVTSSAVLEGLRRTDGVSCSELVKVFAAVALAVFVRFKESPLAYLFPVAIRSNAQAAEIVGNFLNFNIAVADPAHASMLFAWLENLSAQLAEDVRNRHLYVLEKESLLPSALQAYGKCQLRFQFFDIEHLEVEMARLSSAANLSLKVVEPNFEFALADLSFYVVRRRHSLSVRVIYNQQQVPTTAVQELVALSLSALDAVAAHVDASLSAVVRQLEDRANMGHELALSTADRATAET